MFIHHIYDNFTENELYTSLNIFFLYQSWVLLDNDLDKSFNIAFND